MLRRETSSLPFKSILVCKVQGGAKWQRHLRIPATEEGAWEARLVVLSLQAAVRTEPEFSSLPQDSSFLSSKGKHAKPCIGKTSGEKRDGRIEAGRIHAGLRRLLVGMSL